ncbi:uncharacterized protein LOC124420985 [Lucilia cuprina]|uniref:uncharacterized protein LOC124420985 n=1 Tax=Lucilia cuprina TaxID=7375 RepID=UPI001F05834D|nr:uncharacterized protein LOC124420985 [Lucilia cuprina]
MENFPNPCEVERKICFIQQEHRIVSSGLCASNPAPHSQCPQVCTLEYKPVCAQYQTDLKQFRNQCQLDKEKCETKIDWQLVDTSYCVAIKDINVSSPFKSPAQDNDCPEFCTLEYQPICARFMTLEKEFSNECELKTTICQTKQKWDIIRRGPCQESKANMALDLLKPKNKCPVFCTLEYDPICAKLGNELREFANKCELETAICRNKEDWQIIEQGPCPSVSNNKALKLEQKPKCPQFCTLEYRPICAQFEQELREFGNKCELETTICETGQDWQVVNNGPCSSGISVFNQKAAKLSQETRCPQFCTLEYSPICAQFNNELREFSNKCDLESTICLTKQKWEIVHEGNCNSEQLIEQSKCPQVCTLEYRPICAQFENDLREFFNNCDLQRTICETKQKWQVVKQGPCFSDSSAEINECPQFCTREYRPVCAEFKGEEREFPNKCVLLKAICENNKKWELVKHGPCSMQTPSLIQVFPPKCPKFCTREFDPVCAKLNNELRQFSNRCVLESWKCDTNEKWEFVNKGPCPSIESVSNTPVLLSSTNKCPKFCTREFNPVCAKLNEELKEFSNKCELELWNCETDEKWELVKMGRCSATIKPASAVQSSPNKCPKFCTREFDPVCAKLNEELREFSNKCVLESWKCESDEKWELVNLGPCSTNKPVSPTSSISSMNLAKKLTPTPLVSCPKFCSREYKPVCAQFESELREFANRCELQRENCESNKPWVFVNSGPCFANSEEKLTPTPLVSCPKFCSREYEPVCAQFESELREFPNRCELQRENCESNKPWIFVNSGPCFSNVDKKLTLAPLTPPCPQFCTDNLRPVCAEFNSELREFGNRCEMQITICETKNKWKIVNEGPCPSTSKLRISCPKFCTKEFRPVCARFKGELREFPNKCEFQRSVCKTNIAWELINNGPCLIKNFETDSIELQPICATDGNIKRIFDDSSVLQEEIRKTGIAWSLLHNDECLPLTPLAKVANKAFFLATESATTKPTTTSTTPKTSTTTTSRTTTTTTPKLSTTRKTTTILKTSTTTPKTTTAPRSSTSKTTAAKPYHTTTTKTITATTTSPKSTTETYRKYSSTTVKPKATDYPRYSPTTASTPHHQCSYEYSTEVDSAEIDDSSKGYYDENCGCNSGEDYSQENENDEEYISWEDDEEEYEEEEDDISKSHEVEGSFTIDDNTYTYKHNKTNSTYTFIYGEDSINSNGNKADERKLGNSNVETKKNSFEEKKHSESNNDKTGNKESIKPTYSTEPKGKQGTSKNYNLKSGHTNTVKKIPGSLSTSNLKITSNNNAKSGNVRTSEKNLNTFKNKENREDFNVLGDKEGKNIIKLIQERLEEEFGSPKPHDMTKQSQGKERDLNTKQQDQIKANLGKTKANTKEQVLIRTNPGQAIGQKVQNLAHSGPTNPYPDTASSKDAKGRFQEIYGNLGQPNYNSNTEQRDQVFASPEQLNLNLNTDLHRVDQDHDDAFSFKEIFGNHQGQTDLEQSNIDSNSALFRPEYYVGPKDIDNHENLLGNFHHSDESLEADISYEEDTPNDNFKPVTVNEKEPKFGVYSDEAYGLMDSAEISKTDKWSGQNQLKSNLATGINTNNDINSPSSAYSYQDYKGSKPNEQIPKYSTQSQVNTTENTEKILEVFEALLSESDAEEEDDETLVKQVLTTIGSETTAAYPLFEDVENQSNYTKREEYPSKYNSTKKGEIYNGAVYKAPVYDAPTYNFIYTAPNHPVLPLLSPNNHHAFSHYPAFMPQYTDAAANPYNPFMPLVNQSNLGALMESAPNVNNPFNPLQYITSLAAMSTPFGSPMPNLMPLPQASEYNSNSQSQSHSNPLKIQETPSQFPLNPSSPAVFNQILPQTHPSPLMFLPPPPEPFLNSFSPLNNIAAHIPKSLPFKGNRENDNNQPTEETEGNLSDAEVDKSELPQYPQFPSLPPVPVYNNPVNPQMHLPSTLLSPMATNALPHHNFQSMPYLHPTAPMPGPMPLNVFNATLFSQIEEILKTITSRY